MPVLLVVLLELAGLALIVAGAVVVWPPLGLLVAGVACLWVSRRQVQG